ncbi:hypothetical protein ASF10_13415 [Flavobacterium sp. Leaf82]|uniref:hypothetical protein n=1 Tax=unclassified Flavobacterium TaxID=196869 RepID=UPI0007014463|nr:hypothetical protein [Flavobacterium sp. Leaf82]KQO21122.1 hypothetical protein ASF10_13415 [Flavobacterium sp. Leaf82]
MKTVAVSQDVNGGITEKNTILILEKLNNLRDSLFKNEIKFSKKAKEEKLYLFKNMVSKTILSLGNNSETYLKIVEDVNFSKLEKEDQDFILGLEKAGFKNSKYISEIKSYIDKENNLETVFSVVVEENIYLTLLNMELSRISGKLLNFI